MAIKFILSVRQCVINNIVRYPVIRAISSSRLRRDTDTDVASDNRLALGLSPSRARNSDAATIQAAAGCAVADKYASIAKDTQLFIYII